MFTRLSVKRIWPMPDQNLSSCPNVPLVPLYHRKITRPSVIIMVNVCRYVYHDYNQPLLYQVGLLSVLRQGEPSTPHYLYMTYKEFKNRVLDIDS